MSLRPENIHDLIDVTSPTVSPDGNTVVYVETSTKPDRSGTASRLIRISGDHRQVLTTGPSDTSPAFSPDGLRIAFLRPGEGEETKQVWSLPTDGGEAQQITRIESGVQSFVWSPGSDRLAIVSRVDPDDREDDGAPKTQVVRRIRYRDDGEGWRGDAFSQLFVVDLDGGEPVQLTHGEGDHLAPAWSPEGARIAFVCDALEGREYSRHSEIRVITVDGSGEAVRWSEGMTRAGSVAWSHDGHQLVAAGSHDADVWDPRQSWLYVLEEGQHARAVAGDVRAVVQPIPQGCWTPNDDLIYIADQAGESYLCSVHADGGEEEVILGGEMTLTSLCVVGKKAAAVGGTTERPGDIYEIDLTDSTGAFRTMVNAGLLKDAPPASVEKIVFDREGWEIQARLLFPEGFDASKQYPLILEIHGGPNGRFSDSYDVVHQILVGQGYLVLAVNPRGSSTYGPEFMKAVLRDWGGEDFLDLMAAVDLVSERDYVDTDRLGVHGYSYGGFMSSWIIGHDHRFKAAVIGAPVTNLYSFYGTSDIGVSFGENQFGGSTLENVEALVERSPLTYAAEVKTPALLMTGEADYRCPIEQTEQFFVALKRQGKEAEFVRFPDGSHGFRRTAHPKLREEYYERMVQWFRERV
jgi:dipeptidyl aminopeptidase/acylaminoacyl peptidase